ncbi:MAG: hypothetical protein ALECFALPRED_008102 [Alectoria fallacina]|uniref:NAD-dependent epimerase/dehydratase domain-containing protein n=1 Tax=Alectoria fallacina TaxID=1903189 RepID=A0A8H3IDX4_9LECA|nr:MAG: hypothetical protein ALECFALPRED_008102 [Alectoria fallacina]
MPETKPKSVLVTGANGYIGNAVARAFVRAGWITYGLVRNQDARASLRADEIISILGSASDKAFVERSANQTRFIFDVMVSCTEQIMDYIPHYNDTITLLRALAEASNKVGLRPLVIFTSGCKDYGTTGLDGSEGLSAHTEESPLNAPPLLVARATHAIKIFNHTDLFDAVVIRPTTLYGLSGSFYGPIFDIAAKASEKGVLELTADPKSIMHGTHVDDCAEAYVAIAEADRSVVKGQCYDISGRRYETLREVANALVEEYKIKGGVEYLPEKKKAGVDVVQMLIGFSQWVGSEKLRRDVGWRDKRQLFSEAVHTYRKAYEAAVTQQHGNVLKIQGFVRIADGDGQNSETQ